MTRPRTPGRALRIPSFPETASAPDLAGTGTANPLAAIRCTALLLDYFGYREASRSVNEAVHASIRAGVTTPDLGGSHGTEAVGSWVAAAVVENDAD